MSSSVHGVQRLQHELVRRLLQSGVLRSRARNVSAIVRRPRARRVQCVGQGTFGSISGDDRAPLATMAPSLRAAFLGAAFPMLLACGKSHGADPLTLPLAARFDGAPVAMPEIVVPTGYKDVSLAGFKGWMQSTSTGIVGFEAPDRTAFVQLDARKGAPTPPSPMIVGFSLQSLADGPVALEPAVDGKVGGGHFPAKIQEGACKLKGAAAHCWALVVDVDGAKTLMVAGAKDDASPDLRAKLADAVRSISDVKR